MRAWAHLRALAVAIGAVAGASAHSQAQALDDFSPASIAREFSPYDEGIQRQVTTVLEKRRIATLSQRDPSSPELIALAFKRKQFDSAFAALKAAASASPDRLVGALNAASRGLISGLGEEDGQSPSVLIRLLMALEPIAARVPTLPREHAARVVLSLYQVETRFGRPLRNSVTDLWSNYADTDFAAFQRAYATIDAVPYNKDRLAALDRLASGAPHSILSAAALRRKAAELARNLPSDQDPTEPLLGVLAIVHDLESGEYPSAPFDDSLLDVVTQFYIGNHGHVASENRPRLMAASVAFLRSHARIANADDFCSSSAFYWITQQAAPAIDPQDPSGAVTRLFNEGLRDGVHDANRLDLCLARFDLTDGGVSATGRDAQRARGIGILSRLATSSSPEARPALAMLAAKAFFDRDETQAAALLDTYVARFPDGPWAWVGAMKRVGIASDRQSHATTARAYLEIARKYSAQPMAPVIAAYLAGWNFEQAGAMPQALAAYQEVRRAWEDDTYSYDFPSYGDTRSRPPYQPTAIRFAELTSLIARLTLDLNAPGGSDLARAHRLLDEDRFDEATAVFRSFLRTHPTSPQAAAARRDMHKAQFRRALELGNIFRKEHDDLACFAILDQIERDPYDFYVAAAGLARSSILHRQGKSDEAHRVALATVERLHKWRSTEISGMRLDPLDAELAAIRSDLLRPGSPIAETSGQRPRNMQWPQRTGTFAQMSPAINVTINGKTTTREVWQAYAFVPNSIPIDTDEAEALDWIAFAGNDDPRAFPRMIGQGVDDLLSWRDVLGDAGAYISKIVFINTDRTLATMSFGWEQYGFSARIEKFEGHWRVVEISSTTSIYG